MPAAYSHRSDWRLGDRHGAGPLLAGLPLAGPLLADWLQSDRLRGNLFRGDQLCGDLRCEGLARKPGVQSGPVATYSKAFSLIKEDQDFSDLPYGSLLIRWYFRRDHGSSSVSCA